MTDPDRQAADAPPTVGADDTPDTADLQQQGRRDFLLGLGCWSRAVIGAAVFGGLALPGGNAEAGAWANRRGGWINGGGGWVNGGGGGGSWVNRGGGGWVNRRGGGSWVNRR